VDHRPFPPPVGSERKAGGIRCITHQLSQTQHTIELCIRAPPPRTGTHFFADVHDAPLYLVTFHTNALIPYFCISLHQINLAMSEIVPTRSSIFCADFLVCGKGT
jgi:hypothetical protein